MKNLASLAPFSLVGIIGMLYTTLAMAIRYFGGSYVSPGGQFAATALTAPVFGNAGAKAALSAKSLILTCMLSNAYIVSEEANTAQQFLSFLSRELTVCAFLLHRPISMHRSIWQN